MLRTVFDKTDMLTLRALHACTVPLLPLSLADLYVTVFQCSCLPQDFSTSWIRQKKRGRYFSLQ